MAKPEPEPEPESAPEFRCQDTPTGQVGFAVLIIDASATEDQERLLFQYQSDALCWDIAQMAGQFEALGAVSHELVGQDATVVDLRVKTGQGGEDQVKAAFRSLKSGSFEAVIVFIYQVNCAHTVSAPSDQLNRPGPLYRSTWFATWLRVPL